MMPFDERAREVFIALGTTPSRFAKEHPGFNHVSLFNLINPDRRPSLGMLERICVAEPRISAEYLIRGEGSPLRTERQTANFTTVDELRAFKQEMNQVLDKRIAELAN